MNNELAKTLNPKSGGSTWDTKKIFGVIMGVILVVGVLAGVGTLLWLYILPGLMKLVGFTIVAAVGAAIAMVLFWVFSSPKFWLGLRLLGESIAQNTLGHFIEMDRFGVLQMQIDDGHADRAKILAAAKEVGGENENLIKQVQERDQKMKINKAKVNILAKELSDNYNEEKEGEYNSYLRKFNNDKLYIDKVQPLVITTGQLHKAAMKAYTKHGQILEELQDTLNTQKDIYNTVTKSAGLMNRVMKAFNGDPTINNAADQALASISKELAAATSNIKMDLTMTNEFMRAKDLDDQAKASLAANLVSKMDDDPNMDYSKTIGEGPVIIQTQIPVAQSTRVFKTIE